MFTRGRYFIFAVLVFALTAFAACHPYAIDDINPGSNGNNASGSSSSDPWVAPASHVMVPIASGTFQMGGSYTVTLTKDFYMGKYQVTQELYLAVMGINPSSFTNSPASGEVQAKRPVERVSWYNTLVFCNKLSVLESLTPVYSISGSTNTTAWGSVPIVQNTAWDAVEADWDANGYRLPTEAEWEYACRAGTTTAYSFGNDTGSLAEYAWYGVSSSKGGMTHEAGKKTPNAWGLHDMHGNVWEWCWDRYGSSLSAGSDPTGPASGSYRIDRGGSWNVEAQYLRSAYRGIYYPHYRVDDVGFRVARLAQ